MIADFAQSGIHTIEGFQINSYNNKPYEEFTLSATNYPTIQDTIKSIRAKNMRVYWGISSAISNDPNYQWFTLAQNTEKCLVVSGNTEQPTLTGLDLVSVVDGVHVSYIDPFSEKTLEFYQTVIPSLQTALGADYIIDGFEIVNAHHPSDVDGEYIAPTPAKVLRAQQTDEASVGNYQPYLIDTDVKRQSKESTFFTPFIPNYKYSSNLDNRTVSLNATYGKSITPKINLHNTIATENFWTIHQAAQA